MSKIVVRIVSYRVNTFFVGNEILLTVMLDCMH